MRIVRAKYIAAVILYGTIGMFLRYVSLPSEFVAMCRGTIGSLFILAFLAARHTKPDLKAIRENALLLVLSGICLGLNWIFLFAAYIKTTVAIASLCNYMAPVIVVVVSPLVLKERLDMKKLPLVGAAIIGIVMVSGVLSGERGDPSGIIMGLFAALSFVFIVLCNRKLTDISAFDRSIVQLAVSALTILPYFLVHNRGITLDLDTRSVLIILMLGILHTGVAYIFYFGGMASLPVQSFAILGYLEPVVSVLCSVFFLKEPMSLTGWAGAALIIAAALLSEITE